MNIKVVNDKDLSPDKKEQVLSFIYKCFGKENADERKLLYFSPTYKHLFLYKKDKLISYLRIIKRETEFENNSVIIGGIGDVSTLPKHRGRGYATMLLQRAMDIFQTEKFDIGLLQTNVEKGGKLYSKVGFIPAKKSYKFIDSTGKLHTTKAKDVMIAPVGSKETMDKILNSKKLLNVGKGDW